MTQVEQYIERTTDIVAYHGVQLGGERLLSGSLGDANGNGEICTGVIRLGQRFLLELLTQQGSMQFLPERGCRFLTDVYKGYLRNAVDVFASLARAFLVIERNLRAEETADDPSDERYGSATATRVVYKADKIIVYITLASQADKPALILPVGVTI